MDRQRFSKAGSVQCVIGKMHRPAVMRFFVGVFVIAVGMGLAGCGKSCKESDKELASYISGTVRYKNPDKQKEKCLKIAEKCPNLSSPYEFMGDLEIQAKRYEQGIAYFQKALNIAPNNERIEKKIDANTEIIEKQKEKQAAEAMKRIADLPLSEYVKLDESVRLEWCDNRLSAVDSGIDQVNLTNPNYAAEVDMSPERLDFCLKDTVVSDPSLTVAKATQFCLAKVLRIKPVFRDR